MDEFLFWILRNCQRNLHLETLAVSSLEENSSACREACQNSRLIFLHVRATFLPLLFKIVHSRDRLIFGSPHALASRHAEREKIKMNDENRILLLLWLDTYVRVRMNFRCAIRSTILHICPHDILRIITVHPYILTQE